MEEDTTTTGPQGQRELKVPQSQDYGLHGALTIGGKTHPLTKQGVRKEERDHKY